MDQEQLKRLPLIEWMPSRIPLRDALAATIPEGVALSEDRIPAAYERRWYPQDRGDLRLLIPYEGQQFDATLFHVEPGAWDHTTCKLCGRRIPPMTLCYVTKFDPYIELCSECYEKHVINCSGFLKRLTWHAKRLIRIESA